MLIPQVIVQQTGGGGGLFDAYALLREEKADTTVGGSMTAATWNTRELSNEVFDTDNIVSLASDQFMLNTGTYFIHAAAPGYRVGRNKLRLQNITDATTAALGQNFYFASSDGFAGSALLEGRITISGAKTFELQHYVASPIDSLAAGVDVSAGVTEIYAEVLILREAS